MTADASKGLFGEPVNGRIGVLIEEHFDQTEYKKFNEFFPGRGYQVVYMSQLWGNPSLYFRGNPDDGVVDFDGHCRNRRGVWSMSLITKAFC